MDYHEQISRKEIEAALEHQEKKSDLEALRHSEIVTCLVGIKNAIDNVADEVERCE